jgi:hypothetical protein
MALALGLAALGSPAVRSRIRGALPAEACPLAAWAIGYPPLIVLVAAWVGVDVPGFRLLGPGAFFLALVALGVLARATTFPARVAAVLAVASLLVTGAALAQRAWQSPPVPMDRVISWSPRLTWIRDHVGPEDLLIGDDSVDLPYYFSGADGGPRRVASFSPLPYMAPLDRPALLAFVHARRPTPRVSGSTWPPSRVAIPGPWPTQGRWRCSRTRASSSCFQRPMGPREDLDRATKPKSRS